MHPLKSMSTCIIQCQQETIQIFKPGASPVPDVKSMKDELKSFLKNKIKEDSGTSTISSLDSFSSSSSSGFANY
jgi:hypothetical protein